MGTPAFPPGEQCGKCAHYLGLVDIDPIPGLEGDYVPTCRAFPLGIPESLLLDHENHSLPFRGDRGIRFSPVVP